MKDGIKVSAAARGGQRDDTEYIGRTLTRPAELIGILIRKCSVSFRAHVLKIKNREKKGSKKQ